MFRSRTGFSMMELLIVMVLVGGLTAIAMPKITRVRESSNLQSARQQFTASLATARAAAVQKGRPAKFVRDGSTISVSVDTGGTTWMVIVPPRNLQATHKVWLDQVLQRDSVLFDSRGFASPPLAGGVRYLLRTGPAGIRQDSICIGVLGQILPRGCAL